MPATSVYGLRYQAVTDPPNGAILGQNLAEDVEAELVRIDAAANGRCVKRGERSTDYTAAITTTELGIFRLDNIPTVAGRRYAIACTQSRLGSATATDEWIHRLRLNETGTATTASTAVAYLLGHNNRSVTPYAEWTATVTASTASVLLSGVRNIGSGSGAWVLNGVPFLMSIVDLGVAPANTGIVL